ncbi:hypothetical protein D9757_012971 [Collybiopsis confluens]|uniref:Zinc finger PHD-type domain-containing protein n=1 Tax=Collybiopsis confluens TaxID=2823264 RepID=A0A8H5LQC5_9AGAR|nr:hypothetical protein D9757_012971 [Collybiopsis confluens]
MVAIFKTLKRAIYNGLHQLTSIFNADPVPDDMYEPKPGSKLKRQRRYRHQEHGGMERIHDSRQKKRQKREHNLEALYGSVRGSQVKLSNLVPIYSDGKIIGYTEVFHLQTTEPTNPNRPTTSILATSTTAATAGASSDTRSKNMVIAQIKPQVKSLPVPDLGFSKWSPIDLSNPAPLSQFISLDSQSQSEARNLCDLGVNFTSLDKLVGGWNGWPSGKFAFNLSHEEYHNTKNLQVHWATRNIGGDRKGSRNSLTLDGGKMSHKDCLGIMHCENPTCSIITRPFVKSNADRKHQLETPCSCGAVLQYFPCGSRSHLIIWGQIGDDVTTAKYRYVNGDAHLHSQIPHVKHFGKNEEQEFQKLVNLHPNLGPAALMLGPKTIDGYGSGAANIGPAGRNPAFVAYQRRHIKSQAQGGHSFLKQFRAWQIANPGLIRTAQTNDLVSIISFQTPWMRDRLVPDLETSQPLYGLVSDGAHGFWNESSLVLIVTSIFCEELQFWVPGLFTYSDGTSSEHYRYHFKGVFESIAEVAESKDKKVQDSMFEMVVDFSDPQRIGFELAFIDFWLQQDDNKRSRDELKTAGSALLRGCEYHYSKSIERVSRTAGIIPPNTRDTFIQYARRLMYIESTSEYSHHVHEMRQKWSINPWLSWWTRPEIARMIFASQRTMALERVALLPNTTNAEESMHAKIYNLVGRNHELISGINALKKVEEYHHELWLNAKSMVTSTHYSYSKLTNSLVGVPNHYGKSGLEYRNELKAIHNRTKPSRNPEHHSSRNLREGRAPDDLKSFRSKTGIKKPSESGKAGTAKLHKTFDKNAKRKPTRKPSILSSEEADHDTLSKSEEYCPTSASDSESKSNANSDIQAVQVQLDKDRKHIQKNFENASPTKHVNQEHTLAVIDITKFKEIPSYPWSKNSCWIDSSLEALYCALSFHNSWTEFESLVENEQKESSPSPVYYLYLCLKSRRLRPISGFPKSSNRIKSQGLQNLRDSFREMLFKIKMVTNSDSIDSYQPALAWFTSIIAPGNQFKENAACRAYFAGVKQRVWICNNHLRVDRTVHLPAVFDAPFPELFNKYGGSIQKWIKSLTNAKQVLEGSLQEVCWRKNSDNAEQYCAGTPKLITFLSAIPVILTLEPNLDSLEQMWDFPKALYPLAKTEGNKHGVVYNLVARIFYNSKSQHFITRYAVPTTALNRLAVFTYDGMKNCGYSQFETGSVEKLLAGSSPPIPLGYKTHAVVYKLQGGIQAQNYYAHFQNSQIVQKLQLQLSADISYFSNPEYREMDKKETTLWHQAHTREYCLKSTEVLSDFPVQAALEDEVKQNSTEQILESKTSAVIKGSLVSPTGTMDVENGPEHPPSQESSEHEELRTSSPAPLDPAHVLCRCGVESDGHREPIAQEIVCCNECGRYTHLACLTQRQTPQISGDFFCHICQPQAADFTNYIPTLRKSKRRLNSIITSFERLFPGKGALIKVQTNDKYYYPGRILAINTITKTSTVHMWRGIHGIHADKIFTQVPNIRIIDGLYGNAAERRLICLGKYDRPHCAAEKSDNFWMNPKQLPCDTHTRKLLQNHKVTLNDLLMNPLAIESVDSIPALKWLHSRSQKDSKIPFFCGGITLDEQARINHFFHEFIVAGRRLHPSQWDLPLAHCRTIFVADRYRDEFLKMPECPSAQMCEEVENFVLSQAWGRLDEYTGLSLDGEWKIMPLDVDMEALILLDRVMFDRSEDAGVAGNSQWGLDVGMLEDNWDPYDLFAPERNGQVRQGNDELECKRGSTYNQEEINTWLKAWHVAKLSNKPAAVRPQPKPKGKTNTLPKAAN